MKILAIDYGLSKIGLAASDTTRTIAAPLGYIVNRGDKKNIAALIEKIKAHSITKIVMGIALHVDGGESKMSAEARRFGSLLSTESGVEVVYHNEYSTTKDAEQYLREVKGVKCPRKFAEMVDTLAACMLLQDYLETVEKRKGE